MTEADVNRAAADRILKERRWQDRELRDGECLALLDGEVVAVAPNLDDALQALRSAAPDPSRGMIVEVADPAVDVIR